MLLIANKFRIPESELEWQAIRAQGPGGQHVNKVSSAMQLRFDIPASSLPPSYRERLLALRDQRISSDGVVIIKAQEFRSQERNRQAALARLAELLASVARPPKKRRPTKPTRGSQQRRMDSKNKRGKQKTLRGKVDF